MHADRANRLQATNDRKGPKGAFKREGKIIQAYTKEKFL